MADIFKDLVQNLRTKPATSFSSAGSPLSLVQYISDTIPLGTNVCPSVEAVTRAGIEMGEMDFQSMLTITTQKGELVEIGIESEGATFGDDGAAPFTGNGLEVTANVNGLLADPTAQASLIAGLLKKYSFLDVFVKGTRLVVLDRDGNNVTWGLVTNATSSDISVNIAKPIIPAGYRRGDYWEKCKFMRILDVWIEGQDDEHLNITMVLKADLQKMGDQADNVNFPDDYSTDGSSVDYPYFGESEEIAWEFEVTNPDNYSRAPSCQPHPTNPNALLISEREVREGGALMVSRIYRHIGPVSEQSQTGYRVIYENPDGANLSERFPVVTIGIDVLLEGYSPPQCGAFCPVNGDTACGNNAELDFTSLVLIEPAVIEPLNTVYGKMTAAYGRLPGYISTNKIEDARFGSVEVFRQRIAPDGSFPAKGADLGDGKWVIDAKVVEENPCAREVEWQVASLPSCERVGRVYNRETGELDEFTEYIIPTSQVPATIRILNESGEIVTVVSGVGGNSAANNDYIITATGVYATDDNAYYLSWEDPNWVLYLAGDPDTSLASGTGGNESSPSTATWADYTVETAPERPVGSLNDQGFYATDRPLDCHFSAIVKRKASPFISRSYLTYQNYSWPPVLGEVEMMDWVRQDGASDTYPRVVWSRAAYSGPCRALITETWSREPAALDTVSRMKPEPILYSCPAYRISIPPSLHAAAVFTCDFGSEHSIYTANTGSTRTFPATNPPDNDWPASLVVSCTQRPYQGGYLKRTIRVYQPD